MKGRVIADTGPLVALLNRRDHAHAWVVQQLSDIQPPLLTFEAVMTEATSLVRDLQGARIALIEMLGEGCRWPTRASCGWPSCTHKAQC